MEADIQIYNNSDHYEMLCHWFIKRDLPIPKKEMLSDLGLVVNNTAIGFLFKTNSKTAYIDNIVTNPSMLSLERDNALKILLGDLILAAKKAEYSIITMLSNTPDMDNRLFKLGFSNFGIYSLYYKNIGGM